MNKKPVLFIAVVLIALFLFGCTQTQNRSNEFSLDNNFTLQQGAIYTNSDTNLSVRLESITDSLCPKGVQCIWAGELGANIKIYGGGLIEGKQIYLGMVRAKRVSILNYSIEIISVDIDKNEAIIKISKALPLPLSEKIWFSIKPKQCKNNEWNDWANTNITLGDENIPDLRLIPWWLSEKYGVESYLFSAKRTADVVCEACSCATGETIAVLVDSNNLSKMISLGFTKIDEIACTKESKICPDGFAVGRTAPFCEFTPCP